jgi:hypothetical protein
MLLQSPETRDCAGAWWRHCEVVGCWWGAWVGWEGGSPASKKKIIRLSSLLIG